ncbi:uncharacterized protein LOC124127210 [Haliotis rufescens]|uniref:uncharacterized protein LOC124127210 n=1 Tax=Haliotis rufescens TaxID=6454 RepID=UPI00201F5EDC|nr:uncharacterized protein LOC124127210 [Haliotis rufescens]
MDSPKGNFTCPVCDQSYRDRSNLGRHMRTSHRGDRFICEKCTKSYTTKWKLNRHKCAFSQGGMHEYRCSKCSETCASPRELAVHFRLHSDRSTTTEPQPSTSSSGLSGAEMKSPGASSRHATEAFSCRTCHQRFLTRSSLYRHQMTEGHRVLPSQSGSGDGKENKLQDRPWGEDPAPWDAENGQVAEPGLQEAYDLNAPFILAPDHHGDVLSTFNVPVTNVISIGELMERARDIYQTLNYSFRMNLAFGVILRHVETGRYRYFHPYVNDAVFSSPIYVTERKGLERLRQAVESLDLLSHVLKQRPDTKWKTVLITNVQFYVYRTNFPLGHPPSPLPAYIKNHKAIYSLDCNHHGQLYEDHLCAFRCLALHRNPSARRSLEKPARALYYQWVVYSRGKLFPSLDNVRPEEYTGLDPDHFSHFESCFGVNLSVYTLNEIGIAQPLYKSRGRFNDDIFLNRYESHLSLITDMKTYCKRYQCLTCEKLFRHKANFNQHQRTCTGQTTLSFPGGFHRRTKSVFDELEEYGLSVESGERFFPWFIVFDFECLLQPIDQGTEKLRWMQEHRPISVSVCSNVEGFTSPHCIVNADQEVLIGDMIDYMSQIASRVNELATEKWSFQLGYLRTRLANLPESGDEEKKEGAPDNPLSQLCKQLSSLYGKLYGYCCQVPVLGFNSARYDLNVIKEKLPKHLSLDDAESCGFTVKKNNGYLCQSNESFKFLDVTQYLSPGTSYAQFLKAFGVQEKKGFFPYEYLDKVDKLEETRLPPLGEAWHSSLKQKSVLDDGLKSVEDNYTDLEEVWRREGMSTFRDFLEWYNNLDVGPFVEAVRAMQRFYFEDGIDLFKTTMSVPGVARQKLFRESEREGVTFALFDKQNKDLYHTIKQNVVGGPSIIFTRFHKAGQTCIRSDPAKPCRRIVGYDANALYLWAIDQDMPTGPFIRRRVDNQFKPETRDRYMSMYYWMDWLRDSEGLDIKHKLNWGREKRIGPYLVDGFIPDTKKILEYNGCYFHGHPCFLTEKARADPKLKDLLEKRCKNTLLRAEFIRSQGYELVEMRECEFLAQLRNNRDLARYIHAKRPTFYRNNRGAVSERRILQGVLTGELFGMVEADIHTPEQWIPGQNPHGTRLSPREYFEEMTPLFCNADVPFEVVGEHMQDYIRENDLSTKPRRMLVGGVKARKMMIATPLLRWYLEHGLVVDRVYQVVEYTPKPCFQRFVSDVCSARREADSDPSKSIRGDTAKLTGNSAYGSVLINKEKHQTVSYVSGQTAASDQVNIPQFRKLTELGDEYFEVEKAKKLLRLDTPVQLGYFILQYAKLRMLQFYYDFMDVYVDRSDFEYCEMDTDSAYMALSAPCLAEVIRPHMKPEYDHQLQGLCGTLEGVAMRWFPRTCCSTHALHDKRTPGLFKLEYEGEEMIGLCSKTYAVSQSTLERIPRPLSSSTVQTAQRLLRRARRQRCHKSNNSRRSNPPLIGKILRKVKFSSKGISKRTLKNPLIAFRQVLRTRVPGEGSNRGFRLKGNTMCTYYQRRQGLTYLYCKRRVLADGVHTAPLDLELCPWPRSDDRLDDTDTFLAELLENLAEN